MCVCVSELFLCNRAHSSVKSQRLCVTHTFYIVICDINVIWKRNTGKHTPDEIDRVSLSIGQTPLVGEASLQSDTVWLHSQNIGGVAPLHLLL